MKWELTMTSSRVRSTSIGVRLGAGFGAMALLLLACVAFGVLRLSALNNSMQTLLDHEARAVLSAALVAQAHETSDALGRAVMADSIDGIQTNLKHADKLRADTKATRKSLSEALSDDAARVALKSVEATDPSLREGMDKVAAAIKSGDTDAARIALNDKSLRGAEAAYLDALEKLDAQRRGAMEEANVQAATAYATGRNLLFAAALVAAALATVLGLWITRSLTGPAAQAVAAATRIASGDLTQDVATTRHDEMGRILEAMQAMQESLRKVVGGVRRNSDGIATVSAEVAQGNQDLSGRTEEQAGALEKTAASMEQLGAGVRQNVENAKKANQLALGASTVAVQGGEVVSRVVDTMKGINNSSKKIADIISVIDTIAFQTNILALNAAVESARAGEQGRGFAVVASEVRSLAQRSAEAAKEIKGLITVSVEQVEQGTALVDQAGATMTEIVNSIKRVTDIMGEISGASTEQSAGVGRMGEAVSEMDQATRRNAALVEKSAAAAESLKQQAQQLVQAVAVFKLAHGTYAAVPATPAAVAPALPRPILKVDLGEATT
jgi:methyl-accepting chemotaxis protein